MLQELVRSFNRAMEHVYFDAVLDESDYQITLLKGADRPYLNSAQCLCTNDVKVISDIEDLFRQHNTPPAFYLDAETPLSIQSTLVHNGYRKVDEEEEIWYQLQLTSKNLQEIQESMAVFGAKNPTIETVVLYPIAPSSLLDEFLAVDAVGNTMSQGDCDDLRNRLLSCKSTDVQVFCSLCREKDSPASTNLIIMHEKTAFFAEGATAPEFRRRGLYTHLIQVGMCAAARMGCTSVAVNCDKSAYSNNTFQRLHFDCLGSRHLFIK